MYKVNIHYCYYILITPPLYHCCHSPPIFPNFCHLSSIHSCLLSPFSCSISPSSCSAFPTAGPFFQFLTIFLPVLAPFPFKQVLLLFSKFDLLPFYLFLPRLSVACPFFPVPIFQLFSLSLFICPIWSTFIYFPVSSLICPAHVLSFMQVMPPFLCSYLLYPLPIRITSFSQFLFPNSLVLPSSSSVCSVSSFFVLNVTMLFCLLG